MKKIWAIILCLVMLLGLCACGSEAEAEPTTEAQPAFQVGFGRVNITPNETVGLTMEGYSNQVSEGVLSYIMGTCVAITDTEDNTLLLYTVDKCEVGIDTVNALRIKLTESTGIPGENITVSGTHTHSSPVTVSMPNYVDQLVKAGEDALADRAPATISAGSYVVPGMNFVRHYILSDDTIAGDNFGDYSARIKAHATDPDETMRLIRFEREGDKKDVVMVNWQVHPKLASTADTTSGKATRNLISADFVGYTRDYVESRGDVLFAYYTGAAANLNPISRIQSEQEWLTKDARLYGEQFGRHVITALAELKPLESGNIGSKTAPLGDRGFNLHAYTVGSSLGFATVPAEIFDITGNQIREGSPCDITFVLTVANGRDTYIPTENVWDYEVANGDTPYEVRICRYPRGTAESLAQTLAAMLTELQGN